MPLKIYPLLLTILCLTACHSQPLPPLYNIPMPPNWQDTGTPNTENNADNAIYQPGRTFTFQYQYLKDGKEYLIGIDTDSENFGKGDIPWKLVEKGTEDESDYAIQHIDLLVYKTRTPMNMLPEQTVLKYRYYNDTGEVGFGELTGLIEDSTRVWLHPPRYLGFIITEFNPFPDIRKPATKDRSWHSRLSIPEEWGTELSLEIEGSTSMDVEYQNQDSEKISTALGERSVHKVTATGTGELGNTSATFYFDEELGFVKMTYENIDGSSLELELIGVAE